MKVNQGDCGGIILRAYNDALSNDAFDSFKICSDHSYAFYTHKPGYSVAFSSPGNNGKRDLIYGGLGQTNRIAVLTQGQTFTFSINGQFLGSMTDQDKVTSHGSIGICTSANNKSAASVTFTNAVVWTS